MMIDEPSGFRLCEMMLLMKGWLLDLGALGTDANYSEQIYFWSLQVDTGVLFPIVDVQQ